jgi:DNA-binding response OmpR family regulator
MEKIQHKPKVLVVEDDLPILNALVDKLTRQEFDVLAAKNGQEGLTIALKERPDVILVDMLMPIMDGSTMMTKLRQENEWGKEVPIMVLTNLSTAEMEIIKAVIEAEPAYYLVKSNWSLAEVVKKVRKTLSRKG